MVRLFFRTIGFLALAGAFAALIIDGSRSVAAGSAAIVPLGRTLSTLSPAGFEIAHAFIETHAPALWDPVLVTILLLPGWLVLGLVGLIVLALSRKPMAKIGYSRR